MAIGDDTPTNVSGSTLEEAYHAAESLSEVVAPAAVVDLQEIVPNYEEAHFTLRDGISIQVTYRGQKQEVPYNQHESLADFAARCCTSGLFGNLVEDSLKVMFLPGRMHTDPFSVTSVTMKELADKNSRVRLIGITADEATKDAQSANEIRSRYRRSSAGTTGSTASPNKMRNWKQIQEEAKYTFNVIKPLTYLPNPEKSQRFLERLAQDPGIKASMRKHRFSVGLLTEMNPAEHTTHESRTLGLNRNRGEVIELRLRTDRYDGYRDYKVIRKTLCHELSHNVWGDHDRNFWDLTKQIEDEVERNDWKNGGHKLTNDEFYNPDDSIGEAEHADAGGWTGELLFLARQKDMRIQV